jgi:hypothetical protein
MQSIIIRLREKLKGERDKGLVHRPLVRSTVRPEGNPGFNDVFEQVYRELRK